MRLSYFSLRRAFYYQTKCYTESCFIHFCQTLRNAKLNKSHNLLLFCTNFISFGQDKHSLNKGVQFDVENEIKNRDDKEGDNHYCYINKNYIIQRGDKIRTMRGSVTVPVSFSPALLSPSSHGLPSWLALPELSSEPPLHRHEPFVQI